MHETSRSENISLSAEALEKALELKHDVARYQGKDLRLYVEGKGCDGFYYGVTFDERVPEDLVFQAHQQLDLIIDQDSFLYCRGSLINWVDDDRGTGFLVDNPQHWKFRGKFYKRKAWLEKFKDQPSSAPS